MQCKVYLFNWQNIQLRFHSHTVNSWWFSWLFHSVITSDTLACDCALKTLVRWKETSPAHSRSLALQGFCSSPEHLVGRSINDLSSEEIPCGKWTLLFAINYCKVRCLNSLYETNDRAVLRFFDFCVRIKQCRGTCVSCSILYVIGYGSILLTTHSHFSG